MSHARRESELEHWACRWARSRGIVASKLTDPTGIMDHVFWLPGGSPLLVEFKRSRAATDPARARLQAYYRKKLARQGYRTARVETKEEFLREAEAWTQ